MYFNEVLFFYQSSIQIFTSFYHVGSRALKGINSFVRLHVRRYTQACRRESGRIGKRNTLIGGQHFVCHDDNCSANWEFHDPKQLLFSSAVLKHRSRCFSITLSLLSVTNNYVCRSLVVANCFIANRQFSFRSNLSFVLFEYEFNARPKKNMLFINTELVVKALRVIYLIH